MAITNALSSQDLYSIYEELIPTESHDLSTQKRNLFYFVFQSQKPDDQIEIKYFFFVT